MTWEEALYRLDEAMDARNYAKRTRAGYQEELRPFIRFALEHGIKSPLDVKREFINQYQNAICTETFRGHPLCANTRMNRLVPLKILFRILTEDGFLILDPAGRIQFPKIRHSLPRLILSLKEVERILSSPKGKNVYDVRNRAILELLYGTGIRNSELRMLKMKDVDLEQQELRIFGKGGKPRVVPMGAVAASALTRYLSEARPKLLKKPSEFLFLSTRGGEPLTKDGLIEIVQVSARKANLKNWKLVTPHVLRHSCATHLLRAQAPLRAIQQLLGHAQLSSTQIYTRVEISDLKKVHAKCHPREKGARWVFPNPSKHTSGI